jgi:predicted DNA-binding helix-hairpin-helix protein
MGAVRLGIDGAQERAPSGRRPPRFSPAGQSTQMIVGADTCSDAEVLARSETLYGGYGLKRVYYSAFSPIPDASRALPPQRPPLMREHRLYQADWLMRYYGFSRAEIVSATPDGMLDLKRDPKLMWALANRASFPVDVNRAEREMLLRIPGLGAKSADTLLIVRRHKAVRLEDLSRMAGSLKRMLPFVIAADWRPVALSDRLDPAEVPLAPERQLELF